MEKKFVRDTNSLVKKIISCINIQETLNKATFEKFDINVKDEKASMAFNYIVDFTAEVGELIDSIYYKHWTKEYKEGKYLTFKDRDNVLVELVDVFHFYLSLINWVSLILDAKEETKKAMEFVFTDVIERYFFVKYVNEGKDKEFIEPNFNMKSALIRLLESQNTCFNWFYRTADIENLQKYYLETLKTAEDNKNSGIMFIVNIMADYALGFVSLLESVYYFGFTEKEFFDVYFKKNELNFKRLSQEYSQDKVGDKDNEEMMNDYRTEFATE